MGSPSVSVTVGLLALLVLLGWYLTFSATRLDRLHARLEGARSALDAQLVRRASVALQIASSGRLDPATSLLLADAAHQAREVDAHDQTARELAESNLTRTLRATFADPGVAAEMQAHPVGRELVHELAAAGLRVQLARQVPQRRRPGGPGGAPQACRALPATGRARGVAGDVRDERHAARHADDWHVHLDHVPFWA